MPTGPLLSPVNVVPFALHAVRSAYTVRREGDSETAIQGDFAADRRRTLARPRERNGGKGWAERASRPARLWAPGRDISAVAPAASTDHGGLVVKRQIHQARESGARVETREGEQKD